MPRANLGSDGEKAANELLHCFSGLRCLHPQVHSIATNSEVRNLQLVLERSAPTAEGVKSVPPMS